MADAVFKDVPEIFEIELGEALLARTEVLNTFRELGPPDLCHVVKGTRGQTDVGSYHYVTGVDASSSASLAAYINSLMFRIEEAQGWISKGPTWKLKSGSYCCFNAFSRVDVRVDVKIPGGVIAYALDLRGDRHEATPELWLETYLSAILRSILYSSDDTYVLEAWRRLTPVPTPDAELRFIQAAEQLFAKGWQVGSDPEVQVATLTANHLTAGLMRYFADAGRMDRGANLFERLAVREPDVAPLLARSYIGMNEEVKAVQILSQAIRQSPAPTYTLLHAQADFLLSKQRPDLAIQLAHAAVNAAPSEFVTWEKLTSLHIELGNYAGALLTLNSCPMFTFNGRDAHKVLTASRLHLPIPKFLADVLPERERTEDDEADPALVRLPAPGLRGTWARAYRLLTRLVSMVGWDELLRTRSHVFVMEEEYRMQKAQAEIAQSLPSTPAPNGNADNASTRGMHSARSSAGLTDAPSPVGENGDAGGEHVEGGSAAPDGLPTIRISTESAREEKATLARAEAERVRAAEQSVAQPPPTYEEASKDEGEGEADGDVKEEKKEKEPFSFSNKRLCERWLDNLFMVLYEDLRVWTIFRAEIAHFKTQHVAYRKTGAEWEILGELGLRLYHREEAKECFQRSLDSSRGKPDDRIRWSPKPWVRLLEMYAEEGDLMRTLQSGIRVAAYANAEGAEVVFPTAVARAFFKLQEAHGLEKIWNTLRSMGLPEPVLTLMRGYLDWGKAFKVEGFDF
ncbi:chaps-domain-containing protein [Peniophora sp. CONT]|nr:chaps-domain-containing protein [Peniophora sp. CONT]